MNETILKFIAKITRKFHPPGTERLIRLLCNPDAEKGFETVIPYDKGLKIRINSSFFVEWFIFFKGHYELKIIRLIKKFMPENGIFVNVGANIGDMALIGAKIGFVIAIEPVPFLANRLYENFKLNSMENWEIHRCAASDKNGQTAFFTAGEGMNFGMGSLYKSHAKGQPITVETKTLDAILGGRKTDIIVIDTEGHDRNVIFGARETISRSKPVIIYEDTEETDSLTDISKKDTEDFLGSLGYSFFRIDSTNTLCLPANQKL